MNDEFNAWASIKCVGDWKIIEFQRNFNFEKLLRQTFFKFRSSKCDKILEIISKSIRSKSKVDRNGEASTIGRT